MTRTHSGSLAAGGLNWDSLPLKLFAGGNAKFWNPADIDALMSLLLLIFPHLALAPYMRGLDPILGLDDPSPEQPALAVRRLVAVLSAAFSPISNDSRTIRSQKI